MIALQVAMMFVVNYSLSGLSQQTVGMPVILKKESGFYIHPNSYFVQSPTKAIYFLFSYPIEKNRIDIATNVIDRGNALAANTIGL